MEKAQYKVDEKYLTDKGTPVIYLGPAEKGKGFKLKCLSGNTVTVPPEYKLLPFEEKKINAMSKALLNVDSKKSKVSKPKLAHKIDVYLIKGCNTVAEIVELIKNEPEAAGKNLSANVHARLVSYRRKKIAIQKTADGKIKVLVNQTGGNNETGKIAARFSKRIGKTK